MITLIEKDINEYKEWYELLLKAKELGITIEEIKQFLNSDH